MFLILYIVVLGFMTVDDINTKAYKYDTWL